MLSRGLYNNNNRANDGISRGSNDPNFHEIDQLLSPEQDRFGGAFDSNSGISAAAATQYDQNRFMSLDPFSIANDDD